MNVEIGAEVALFPEKEYISAIFVAVQKFRSQRVFVSKISLFYALGLAH